jgi:hypothetical protein
VEVNFSIQLAALARNLRQGVEQAARELARFDRVLLAREPVLDRDPHSRRPDAVAQFRGEVVLDFFAGERADARQERLDDELGARVGEEGPARADGVPGFLFFHFHLVDDVVAAGGTHGEVLSHGPETEEADAEFALDALHPLAFEPLFHRVADVGGHVLEIGVAGFIERHARAVVDDFEVMLAFLLAAHDGDVAGAGVNGVLDELGDGFERIVLGEGDDRYGAPRVADLELAGVVGGR